MPGFAQFTGPRVFERLVLQAFRWQADSRAIREQLVAIGRDEMRHRAAAPDVPMQPQAAFHREDHPLAARCEFAVGRLCRITIVVHQSAELRLEPVRSDADVYDQRDRQCRGTLHFRSHERRQRVDFTIGRFEHQFVVYL